MNPTLEQMEKIVRSLGNAGWTDHDFDGGPNDSKMSNVFRLAFMAQRGYVKDAEYSSEIRLDYDGWTDFAANRDHFEPEEAPQKHKIAVDLTELHLVNPFIEGESSMPMRTAMDRCKAISTLADLCLAEFLYHNLELIPKMLLDFLKEGKQNILVFGGTTLKPKTGYSSHGNWRKVCYCAPDRLSSRSRCSFPKERPPLDLKLYDLGGMIGREARFVGWKPVLVPG